MTSSRDSLDEILAYSIDDLEQGCPICGHDHFDHDDIDNSKLKQAIYQWALDVIGEDEEVPNERYDDGTHMYPRRKRGSMKARTSYPVKEADMCDHQFFQTQQVTEVDNCIVTCPHCGEVRVLDQTGIKAVYSEALS